MKCFVCDFKLKAERSKSLGQRVVDFASEPVALFGNGKFTGWFVQARVFNRHRDEVGECLGRAEVSFVEGTTVTYRGRDSVPGGPVSARTQAPSVARNTTTRQLHRSATRRKASSGVKARPDG